MRDQPNYWQRLDHRRTSRRRLLGGAALSAGGLSAMALVGCSGDDDNGNGSESPSPASTRGAGGDSTTTPGGGGTATAGGGNTTKTDVSLEEFRTIYHGRELRKLPGFKKQPTRGGEFHFSIRRPVSFDPLGAAATSLCSYAIFHNQLIGFDIGDHVENHNFTPVKAELAVSMPEQPDDLTYTFKLHSGVHFQDLPPVNGREMTAEDVKYSYEAYAEAPVQTPTFADVESIDVPDNETVIFKMKQPAAYFLNTLVVPYHGVFSREQHAAGGMDSNPIGTGPFILETLTDQAGFTTVRNPNYWRKDEHGTQLPYFDKVVYDYIESPVDADAAFRTKQLDHRYPPNFDAWKDLVSSIPDVVTQVTIPAPSAQPYLIFNLNKPPFDDVRVRRALSLAIDRDAMIDTLAGGMAGYGLGMDQTFLGNEWPLGSEELGSWHNYDPEQAKQLLADAGYPDGIPETLEVFTNVIVGLWFETFVAAFNMWNQIGVTVDHQYSADPAQWQGQFYGKSYKDMMGVTQVGPGYDPDPYTYHALHSQSTRNYYNVNDAELDRLTLEQRQEMDLERRIDLLHQIVDIDLDQVYRIWLINAYKINLRHPYVQNMTDVHAAWSPVGWGSANLEIGWINEDFL